MPDPIKPNHTVAAAQDQPPSIAGGDDETSPQGAGKPRFGPPAAAGEVGTLGPYRVVKELGKGGMGAVYLAIDTRLDRKLALKVMLPEFAADRGARERFLREARAAAKVSHDNVVTVFEADERDGVPYIAMQLLEGCPLDEYLKRGGPLTLPQAVAVGRDAAQGLAAAHALGLVHRDVKPANLWLEAGGGRVKVLDFGLAKPVGTDTELTKSGAVMGTPAYMSPEQARGKKVDHRTDLFSLGVVLYRLCTGRMPFAGEHVMAVLAALIADEPVPVRELNPDVPEPLAALIHQLLAKQPEQRPANAGEVARQLRAILDQSLTPSVGVSVLPVVVPVRPEDAFTDLDTEAAETERFEEPRPERAKGGKGVLIGAGIAVLLAVVASAAVVVAMSRGKPKPEAKEPEPPRPLPSSSPSISRAADPLPATYKNSIGMEFVKVPKGVGWLGGGGGKEGDTRVEFKDDFYLGKYEVTQEEWEVVEGTNPSYFSRTGNGKDAVKDISDADLKRFPVETVSWHDCQLFIERLNKREKAFGWVYRMPTSAEWEYACRGGPVERADSAFDFYFTKPTNTLLPEQANVAPAEYKGLRPCKVGSYEGNLLLLHDMHGNVFEWCSDSWTDIGGGSRLVCRGGHWNNASKFCRAAYRSFTLPPSDREFNLGLRVARVPAAK